VPAPKKRLAVIGAGSFGRNHLRVLRQLDSVDLVAVHDLDPVRTADASQQYSCSPAASLDDLAGIADAAVEATPTSTHDDVATRFMSMVIDVLV
jgi:predicted dehydrogenase